MRTVHYFWDNPHRKVSGLRTTTKYHSAHRLKSLEVTVKTKRPILTTFEFVRPGIKGGTLALQSWSSWTANSDEKLNVNKPCVIS